MHADKQGARLTGIRKAAATQETGIQQEDWQEWIKTFRKTCRKANNQARLKIGRQTRMMGVRQPGSEQIRK